jgi:hypothetical protein
MGHAEPTVTLTTVDLLLGAGIFLAFFALLLAVTTCRYASRPRTDAKDAEDNAATPERVEDVDREFRRTMESRVSSRHEARHRRSAGSGVSITVTTPDEDRRTTRGSRDSAWSPTGKEGHLSSRSSHLHAGRTTRSITE